jgi:hypothetical protein
MRVLLGKILLVLFSVATLPYAGCSNQTSPTQEPLYWHEDHGSFYTNDLAKAQEEVPFPIVLPRYIPHEPKDAAPRVIMGPLSESRPDDRVEIKISYSVDLGTEVLGIITIFESNYPVLPGDPELNPQNEYVEIGGKKLVKTEGNFSLGPGVVFFFEQDSIYYVVELYNFTYSEAVKVIESIIQQSD